MSETELKVQLPSCSNNKLPYYGMSISPPITKGQDCHGVTKNQTKCKRKACTDSIYCSLHQEMYKYDRPNDCIICSEELPQHIRPTKCGHFMHTECLNEWLNSHLTCPICRTRLREPKVNISLEFQSAEDIRNISFNDIYGSIFSLIQQIQSES